MFYCMFYFTCDRSFTPPWSGHCPPAGAVDCVRLPFLHERADEQSQVVKDGGTAASSLSTMNPSEN